MLGATSACQAVFPNAGPQSCKLTSSSRNLALPQLASEIWHRQADLFWGSKINRNYNSFLENLLQIFTKSFPKLGIKRSGWPTLEPEVIQLPWSSSRFENIWTERKRFWILEPILHTCNEFLHTCIQTACDCMPQSGKPNNHWKNQKKRIWSSTPRARKRFKTAEKWKFQIGKMDWIP